MVLPFRSGHRNALELHDVLTGNMEKIKPYLPTLLLVIIIFLGAYVRLYKISEYMTFLGDEGRDMLVMKRMIVDHKFTLLGPTASVGGFFLGPVYYYFMLPFVWIWNMSPVGAAVMVALFGVATIYLLYRLGSDMFDKTVGFIASSLYAVSPLVIAYSRSSWNPNIVPFFSTLLILLLWHSVRRPMLIFWVGVVLGIGLQLHYLFLFLLPVTFFWYIYKGNHHWLRNYVYGCLGFVVGYGPFLLFEVRHGFPNTIAIYNFIRAGEGTGLVQSTFWKNITDVSYRLFGRLLFRLPPPEQWENVSPLLQNFWSVGTKFTILASLGALLFKKKVSQTVLLMVWFFIPLFLFGLYKKGIYDYYFVIFFSLPFLFFSVFMRSLMKHRVGSLIVGITVIAIIYLNWQGRPFLYPPNNQFAQARLIAQAAYEKAGGKPYNFALMTGGNSDHAYRYFFEIWGNPPVIIENMENDPKRQTVTDQLIVICELSDCKPLGASLWEIAGFGRAEIAGEWQVSFVKILKLVHYKDI